MSRLLILFSLAFSSAAFAARDSVAVFHRPEKVVILLNEWPGQGERLKNFIQNHGTDSGFEWYSKDQSVRIYCAYNSEKSSCTIRLLPSGLVSVGSQSVLAKFPYPKTDFAMSFESSMQDRFALVIKDHILEIQASRR